MEIKIVCTANSQKKRMWAFPSNNGQLAYLFLCFVLPDILALHTAYGLTFFPDLRLTFVTQLSNFFVFRPFLTPLGITTIMQHN